MKQVATVIRWPDDTTTPVTIRPCKAGSWWHTVESPEHIDAERMAHCSHVAKVMPAKISQNAIRSQKRRAALEWIAHDERLNAHAVHTRSALIADIMQLCGVKRGTAKHLMSDARRMKRERS